MQAKQEVFVASFGHFNGKSIIPAIFLFFRLGLLFHHFAIFFYLASHIVVKQNGGHTIFFRGVLCKIFRLGLINLVQMFTQMVVMLFFGFNGSLSDGNILYVFCRNNVGALRFGFWGRGKRVPTGLCFFYHFWSMGQTIVSIIQI